MASILYVLTPGGPALEYVLPRIRRHGDIHALVFAGRPESHIDLLRRWCATVRVVGLDYPVPEGIVDAAREVRADAVLTLNEWAVVGVAAACERLGLRGPGPHAVRSRDKVTMRETWRRHGLPIPAFVGVRSLDDLEAAARTLRPPFLLKPSWAASSAGQAVVDRDADLRVVWATVSAAMQALSRSGSSDIVADGRGLRFIAEEIIDSSTESWYEVDGFGDYLSVEGLVVDGRYHPLCITARLRTIPPFIELSNHAPTVLTTERQRRIESMARAAVDALGLRYCGTHMEIKLLRDGGMCLLENAARLGGAMIAREVAEVFGVDMIDLLVRTLLGEDCELPDRMLTSEHASSAAASLSMLAADSAGRPWSSLPPFVPDRVEWSRLTSSGTTVEIVAGHTMPSGSPMPPLRSTGGHMNYAGTLFVRSTDPLTLQRDCYRILDGLEDAMHAAAAQRPLS